MRYFLLVLSFWVSNTASAASSIDASGVIAHAELMRVFSGLLLVLVVIVVLAWLVKRLNKVHLGSSKGFETIASLILGPKEKIMLLRVGSRYLLIGVGVSAINTLCDFGTQLPDGFDPDNRASFADFLKVAVRKS